MRTFVSSRVALPEYIEVPFGELAEGRAGGDGVAERAVVRLGVAGDAGARVGQAERLGVDADAGEERDADVRRWRG